MMINSNLLANISGNISFVFLAIVILASTNNKLVSFSDRLILNKSWSYYILLITVGLGLLHGLLTTQNTEIDFYQLHTYWFYAGGVLVFNLLIFIVVKFRELKSRHQQLKYLNYALLLLLACHIGQKFLL